MERRDLPIGWDVRYQLIVQEGGEDVSISRDFIGSPRSGGSWSVTERCLGPDISESERDADPASQSGLSLPKDSTLFQFIPPLLTVSDPTPSVPEALTSPTSYSNRPKAARFCARQISH